MMDDLTWLVFWLTVWLVVTVAFVAGTWWGARRRDDRDEADGEALLRSFRDRY